VSSRIASPTERVRVASNWSKDMANEMGNRPSLKVEPARVVLPGSAPPNRTQS